MALSNQGQVRDRCLRSVLERKDDTSVVSARIVLRVSRRSFLANVSVVVLSVEIMSEQVVALEHFALEEREVEQALARVNVRAWITRTFTLNRRFPNPCPGGRNRQTGGQEYFSGCRGPGHLRGKNRVCLFRRIVTNGIWKLPRIPHGISPTRRKATSRSPSRIVPPRHTISILLNSP